MLNYWYEKVNDVAEIKESVLYKQIMVYINIWASNGKKDFSYGEGKVGR